MCTKTLVTSLSSLVMSSCKKKMFGWDLSQPVLGICGKISWYWLSWNFIGLLYWWMYEWLNKHVIYLCSFTQVHCAVPTIISSCTASSVDQEALTLELWHCSKVIIPLARNGLQWSHGRYFLGLQAWLENRASHKSTVLLIRRHWYSNSGTAILSSLLKSYHPISSKWTTVITREILPWVAGVAREQSASSNLKMKMRKIVGFIGEANQCSLRNKVTQLNIYLRGTEIIYPTVLTVLNYAGPVACMDNP